MKVKPTEEIIAFCDQYASPMGITIVDVEFKQGKNPALTIFIDTPNGVDLDTCESFHRAIDQPLDELDPTFGLPYTLNVSSPGADRPFKTDSDFLNHIGRMVEVKLLNSIRGKKFLEGELVSYDKDKISLKVDAKTTYTIELKNTVKVNRYIEF